MELPEFTMDNLRQKAEDLVVFMCSTCRLPLGDCSNYYSGEQAEAHDILVNAVSKNVVINAEKILNNYNDKNGSLFQILQCKGCDSAVGKLFFSAPKQPDSHLQKFILHSDRVTVYALGSANKQVLPTSEAPVTLMKCFEFDREVQKCKILIGKLQRKVDLIESFVDHKPDGSMPNSP